MQLIKFEPMGGFDRIFDDRLMDSLQKLDRDMAIDLYEEKGNVIAKMNLPGIESEDIEVSIENGVLTISGKRDEEKEVQQKDYYSKEIRRGSFSRSIALPKTVDVAQAEAKYGNGVLVVTVPVIEGAKEKALRVKIYRS